MGALDQYLDEQLSRGRTYSSRMKGDAWKLTDKAVEALRQKKYPGLLYTFEIQQSGSE